jgi:hypothetical protein
MAKPTSPTARGGVLERRFQTGDLVEVLCDHSRRGERVRDWLQGVVVQSDDKMAAIQFVDDVYLTDGWMIPDRVLWCRQDAETIRPATRRRPRRTAKRKR